MLKVSYRSDKSLTLAQFTDVHLRDRGENDANSFNLMESVIRIENPDLLVLSGDIVHSASCTDPVGVWRELVERMDSWGLPWMFAFGNHDAENFPYESVDELVRSSSTALYSSGPGDIHGWGNYAVQVVGTDTDSTSAVIYCLDSGRDSDGPLSGWGYVHESQVEWFQHVSTKMTGGSTSSDAKNGLTSLMFVHNPLPQYVPMWQNTKCRGNCYEDVCFQGKDTGLFSAARDAGVSAYFCGHDHVNDFQGTYDGVDLLFGRATGYGGYGREGFERGARIVRLTEGIHGYDTHIRLADGSLAELPEHKPETT
jgi:3',5'-cyclic AMP phosphodiesterase CpdA